MPPRRLLPLTSTVTLVVDGRDVPAQEGEPVANAMLASGTWVFGRSVKYHRARGPVCVSGRCEGCLRRVDGVPSVMTCRLPARHGIRCDAQNVMGSANNDLLALTDFMFPAGLDHHEMFTWSKPVNRTMQLVAREIAGVGTLPDTIEAPLPVERRDVMVLVIGASKSGLEVATATARAGRSTLVLDEERTLPHQAELEEARAAGVEVRLGTSALGVFLETDTRRIVVADDVFGAAGAMSIAPKVVVCATGSAEIGGLFEGNDLPGVITLTAAARLLDQGILVGEQIVIASEPSQHERTASLIPRLMAAGAAVTEIPLPSLVRARGRRGVRRLDTQTGALDCDCLVVAGVRAPITELAQQAGAKVRFDGDRFVLEVDQDGRTKHPDTFVAGSGALGIAEPARVAHAVLTRLGETVGRDG